MPKYKQVAYFASDEDVDGFAEVYFYNTPEEAIENWMVSSYNEPPKYLYKATLERATVKKSKINVRGTTATRLPPSVCVGLTLWPIE